MYGQETNQQNNSPQQNVQTPRLPEPQNPGFMQQADPNDLTFLFNEESGQLEIASKTSVPQQQQVDEKFQSAVEQKQAGQATSVEGTQPQAEVDRLGRLEEGFARLIAYLQGQEQQKLNNLPSQQQETQPDYSEVDFTNPNNIVALINYSIQNAMKPYVEKVQVTADQAQVKNSFDFAAAKYGKDFIDVLPKIQVLVQSGILKSDPNMSFENLYLAFKQMEKLSGQTARSDSTIQTVNGARDSQPQTVQTLVQKANALSTESGGVQRSIINPEKPKVNSVEDAVNNAWDQLFGGKS